MSNLKTLVNNLMRKIYYSPEGYWKGYSAVSKLVSKANVGESEVRDWLERQALWQIYLPPPKYVPRPHWSVDRPNEIHQADLLFLPHDTTFRPSGRREGRKTYRYALVVIDVASRYKDAEALTSKESQEVAKAFEKIYSRKKLNWPKRIMVDPGKEFMGSVTKLMETHNVKIQRSEAGNHRAQAFVERANRTLGERLFSHQYAQELSSDERSRVWVKRLPAVMKALNSEVIRITGKEPDKALGLKEVDIKQVNYKRPVGLKEKRLPSGVQVRYLLSPGEDEGGERRRATDPIWSIEVYNIASVAISAKQPVLYYLLDGPKRSFVREELQVVPSDTELPPL